MRLKPTKTSIGLLGGGVVLALLCGGGVFWLQQGALANATTELKNKNTELSEGRQIARRRDAARESLERDREELRFLEVGASDAAYVPTLLEQIESVAKQTGNQVRSIRPVAAEKAPTRLQQRRDPTAAERAGNGTGDEKAKEEKKPDPYTKLGIQISLFGTYQSVQLFTDRLQRFPKIIAVDELQLHPYKGPEIASDNTVLDAQMKVSAFLMKTADEAGAKPGAARGEAAR
jgi:Tfp pilus assembly protein PilO